MDAMCTVCEKVRKGVLDSTGNFFNHYIKDHPDLVDEADLYRQDKVNSSKRKKTIKKKSEGNVKFTAEEVRSSFDF